MRAGTQEQGASCLSFLRAFFSRLCRAISDLLFGSMLRAESIDNNIVIFDDEDILDLNRLPKASDRFLNYLDHDAFVRQVMRYRVQHGANANYTIEEILRSKNLTDLLFDFDTSDFYIHRLHVYNEQRDANHLICQLFIRVNGRFNVANAKRAQVGDYLQPALKEGAEFVVRMLGKDTLDMTIIEWLRLQDYRIQPKRNQMILPNQMHPGLGVGHEIEEVIMHLIAKKGRDGLLNTPEHWYNAYLYYTSSCFHFLNPVFEGFFRSITESVRKDLERYRLPRVAWALAQGKLYHRPSGTKIVWSAQEQIAPLSGRLKGYFGKQYADIVMKNYHPKDYYIRWDDEEGS